MAQGRKAKQKGRILKKMSCNCRIAEEDSQVGVLRGTIVKNQKKLFGCECVMKSMGNKVKGKKLIPDVGVINVNWNQDEDVNLLGKYFPYGRGKTTYKKINNGWIPKYD